MAGQSSTRPALYVRGIIRISNKAGRREGGEGGSRKSGVGVQRREKQTTYIWRREDKGGSRKMGRLLQACLKIKVLRWPQLIFHHSPKLKMWTVSTY